MSTRAVNLRPIETIGLQSIVEFFGEVLGEVWPPVVQLPERLSNQDINWRRRDRVFDELVIADPLAVYWVVGRKRPNIPARSLRLIVIVPHGESVDDGFLIQRFLVRFEGGLLKACPQEPAELLTPDGAHEVDQGIWLTRSTGPEGMGEGLAAEIPHAIAALDRVLSDRQRRGAL